MHYDLDWSTRLRITKSCSSAISDDPCFGTFACICDNGYMRIAENMPNVPGSYDGQSSIIENATILVVDASAAGNSDSDKVGTFVDDYTPPPSVNGGSSGGDASPTLQYEPTSFSEDPTKVVPREPGLDYDWPTDFNFFWDQFEMWQWVAIGCGIAVFLLFVCYGFSKCCCRDAPDAVVPLTTNIEMMQRVPTDGNINKADMTDLEGSVLDADSRLGMTKVT